MLIATFGPTTEWNGKTITHDDGQFMLEGHGPITASAVLDYDRQGHLVWAYDGLREWVEKVAGQHVAAVPPAAPVTEAKRSSIFWPVLGALVVFFVVIPIVGIIGCAACGTAAVVNEAAKTTAEEPPGPTELTKSPTPPPERHAFGQSQIIRDGKEGLEVTPLSLTISKRPPASVAPIQTGKGWVYAIVRVRFKNVGSTFTESQVGMWSRLECLNNAEDNVTADWMGDTQGNMGTLELDPGDKMTWQVTFSVRKTAEPVSYSYQGPGDHTDTWYVK